MRLFPSRMFLCIVVLVAPASRCIAQEWTRFRGPNGSGVGEAIAAPAEWTDADLHWRVKLPGVGHSSPVLWGDRVFLTSGEENSGTRVALCVDARSGETVWATEFPAATHRKHGLNSFASATPAVDGDHVYVSWGTPKECIVVALDHEGTEVWRSDLGGFNSGHGFGTSPIVYNDMVIITNEHSGDSFLFALERRSGEVRWKVPRDSKVTYSTPCVYRRSGEPDALIFTNWAHGISAVDPATGRIRWEFDVFNKDHIESSIASPIVAGDLILGCSGWLAVRQEVVAVRAPGVVEAVDGAELPKEVYRIDRAVPLVTTPLVKDDLLLLWSDQGIVTCADVHSGKVHWRKRVGGTYYGSPVCAGDRVYCMSAEGDAVVLAASKDYEPLGRNPLGEGSHSTPALAGGRMYLRTFSHLMSVGGR